MNYLIEVTEAYSYEDEEILMNFVAKNTKCGILSWVAFVMPKSETYLMENVTEDEFMMILLIIMHNVTRYSSHVSKAFRYIRIYSNSKATSHDFCIELEDGAIKQDHGKLNPSD